LQSEKPRIAKKAEENKIFAKPTPQEGTYMAAKQKKDESVAAKMGSEPEDGSGSGTYSEFLHQWAINVSALYNPTVSEDGCLPVFDVGLERGHVVEANPVRSCGPDSDEAFRTAVVNAPKPPVPISWLNQPIEVLFYATGAGKH
jgi:hypothetical protein